MITEIEKKEHTSQEVGTAPNLGGPTSTYLDSPVFGIIPDFETFKTELKAWADRYTALNEGASQ